MSDDEPRTGVQGAVERSAPQYGTVARLTNDRQVPRSRVLSWLHGPWNHIFTSAPEIGLRLHVRAEAIPEPGVSLWA